MHCKIEPLESRTLFAAVPAGFTETVMASGLASPTSMEIAPDGRIFVNQQGGEIRVIKDGQLLPTPFATLNVDTAGERGVLGIAFDPAFASNHFVYVYCTTTAPVLHNHVVRFTANGDVAAGPETDIFDLDPLSASNHNGGAIHFGIDGKLYIGVGENAVPSNSQSLNTVLGKMLRINPDGSIPTDNPFYNQTTGNNRAIWALGLRNPFTFAVQPGTGRIFINDVGQSSWEEVDDGIAGANYGWPTEEGLGTNPNFTQPLFTYAHGSTDTTGDAITGGTFYDPATQSFPQEFRDKYFFADLTSGWIRVFDPSTKQASGFASGINTPVDLKVASDGSLYYLDRGAGATTGELVRIQSTVVDTNQPPVATILSPKSDKLFRAGQQIAFSGKAIDPEDGKLKPSHLSWTIEFLSNGSTTTVKTLDGKAGGSFAVPSKIDPALGNSIADGFYRILLTATDSQGKSTTASEDLHPQTSTLTFSSNIPGIAISLDGAPITLDTPIASEVGLRHTVETVRQQVINGITYRFVRWSDGLSSKHAVIQNAKNRTLTAIFKAVS